VSAIGKKGYVKTNIFFTTYDESVAAEIIDKIKSNYKVLEIVRSSVLNEIYFMSLEGNLSNEVEELLKDKVLWYKIDILEFK